MRVLYVRARMPTAEETRALGLGDINPIIETSRITTFQNGPALAEIERTSADGIDLAIPAH